MQYGLSFFPVFTFLAFSVILSYTVCTGICQCPKSLAKQFPDYIPKAIRQDYEESCAIDRHQQDSLYTDIIGIDEAKQSERKRTD